MTENAAEPIICPVTAWYHKRKIAMILLLLGLSAFFFYDWRVGYPKKQSDYESYWPEYQRLVLKEKKTAEWFKLAKEKGWPDKPHEEDWDYKIKEQMVFGVITGLIGLGMLGQYLVNSSKTLTADGDSFTTPDGIRVPFSTAFKLDKRKWDNKGLAYVNYQNGDESGKVVIDCLVYGDPAIKVLERLEANFKGEIIDVVKEAPAAAVMPVAAAEDVKQP